MLIEAWLACDKLSYPFGSMAKLLLLTGQRRNEVSGMTWAELDLDKALWRIPGGRTKNDEPRRFRTPHSRSLHRSWVAITPSAALRSPVAYGSGCTLLTDSVKFEDWLNAQGSGSQRVRNDPKLNIGRLAVETEHAMGWRGSML